jgi:chromosomal replication initiator protein
MLDKNQLWQVALGELELIISKANFTTWFKNTFISSLENGGEKVVIAVPNAFTQSWLQNKYHKAILKSLQNATKNKIKEVVYKIEIIEPTRSDFILKRKALAQRLAQTDEEALNKYGLNPRYTFANFIVGKSNELAHAACQAVAESPGTKYNPLFIYSGVGLGKTHLLQAIGHQVITSSSKKKVLYVNAETFTNDFVQAIREGKTAGFKKKYRGVDVLLMDDIQFMAGKEGTQEEFFHTFNELYQNNKQIVITSDRLPKAIPALEERLISRFSCGMIVDISSPDLETRLAILRAKCQERGYSIKEEIILYLASQIQKNVRELEGALNKIIAQHELEGTTSDLDSAKRILSSLTTMPRKGAVTPRQIIKEVADFYELKVEDLISSSRRRELVAPRQIAMYLLRTELDASYLMIGHELGGRDHTTAIHAFNRINKEVDNEGRITQEINQIKQRLYVG